MPRLLTPQEQAQLQIDTNYLDAGIPVFGSRVVMWGSTPVLIYHTENYGYVASDITDLGQSVIEQLAQQSDPHGMWYYLPDAVQQTVANDANAAISAAESAGATAASITQSVASTVGKTLQDLISPVIGSLTIPLVIVGVVLGIYLIKKG